MALMLESDLYDVLCRDFRAIVGVIMVVWPVQCFRNVDEVLS